MAYEDPRSPVRATREHPIDLEAYFISKYEMTQGQWERFARENPSSDLAGSQIGGQLISRLHPVEQVSWLDASRVLRQLGLALPSEAQWEWAVRAGTTTPLWTGGDRESLRDAANLADQAARRAGLNWPAIDGWPEFDDGWIVHAPVTWGRPNPYGLLNVHGNVWEWCNDRHAFHVVTRPGEQGTARQVASKYAYRGGGFLNGAGQARTDYRYPDAPEHRFENVGVRPARPVSP